MSTPTITTERYTATGCWRAVSSLSTYHRDGSSAFAGTSFNAFRDRSNQSVVMSAKAAAKRHDIDPPRWPEEGSP